MDSFCHAAIIRVQKQLDFRSIDIGEIMVNEAFVKIPLKKICWYSNIWGTSKVAEMFRLGFYNPDELEYIFDGVVVTGFSIEELRNIDDEFVYEKTKFITLEKEVFANKSISKECWINSQYAPI